MPSAESWQATPEPCGSKWRSREGTGIGSDDGAVERYSGRLLLDGMGSSSPLALQRFAGRPFAGVCPTVGTVAAGFAAGGAPDEHNPRVGDILVSVAHAQSGQQYLWRASPAGATN